MSKPSKKDQIIKEAVKLFSAYSYDSVSMNDIAKKVGVTKPALYYHFKNKEELFEYIIQSTREEVFGLVQKIITNTELNIKDKLYKCVVLYSSFLQKNHGLLGYIFHKQTKHIAKFLHKSKQHHEYFHNITRQLSEEIINTRKLTNIVTHEQITDAIMALTMSFSKPHICKKSNPTMKPHDVAQKVVTLILN